MDGRLARGSQLPDAGLFPLPYPLQHDGLELIKTGKEFQKGGDSYNCYMLCQRKIIQLNNGRRRERTIIYLPYTQTTSVTKKDPMESSQGKTPLPPHTVVWGSFCYSFSLQYPDNSISSTLSEFLDTKTTTKWKKLLLDDHEHIAPRPSGTK